MTLTVSGVMAFASFLTLKQREASLSLAARDEVMAHAVTLQIALEEDLRAGRNLDAQKLINRLGQNSGIYGVLLFNENGEIEKVSDTLKAKDIQDVNEARRVINDGKAIKHVRRLSGEDVFSIILPLRSGDRIAGAMEIAQPISFVNTYIVRERQQTVITTLLLCIAIFLVVLLVTRYNLTQPIQELLGGAVALGRGDLNYRVIVPANGGEISQLALEFNRMADHLEEQRKAAAHDADEKLALERELRHSERLASVGRLAAGVAHELGAPLQVIDGRAKQLLNQTDAPIDQRQRNLTIIRSQTERITRIVRQLLTLSRPYNLRLQKINLDQLLSETAELIQTNAQRAGVSIEIDTRESLKVMGDPELLNQVFLNICFNAIQEMPNGGTLKIECFEDPSGSNDNAAAVVRFSDTGPGIPPENLPNIFDPFFTTKEVGNGTGLGLAVSSRIIEEHGGWIEAETLKEGGASFTVHLPNPAAMK
ncbi:MAG: HAMP domain-containing protein [Acidobacteria bacterium]|nr:HAMP domain-containing protein [Acidobacteriota bacterium]